MTQGELLGRVFLLSELVPPLCRMVRVGRETSNDIVLSELQGLYVSRFHFTLERTADGRSWLLRDGQWLRDERRWAPSTNGTYLNSSRVNHIGQRIYTGDIITAGEYKLKVE